MNPALAHNVVSPAGSQPWAAPAGQAPAAAHTLPAWLPPALAGAGGPGRYLWWAVAGVLAFHTVLTPVLYLSGDMGLYYFQNVLLVIAVLATAIAVAFAAPSQAKSIAIAAVIVFGLIIVLELVQPVLAWNLRFLVELWPVLPFAAWVLTRPLQRQALLGAAVLAVSAYLTMAMLTAGSFYSPPLSWLPALITLAGYAGAVLLALRLGGRASTA